MLVQQQQQQRHLNNRPTLSSTLSLSFPYFIINQQRQYEQSSISLGQLQMINQQMMLTNGGQINKRLAVSSRCDRLLKKDKYKGDNKSNVGISNKQNVEIQQGQILNVYYKQNSSIDSINTLSRNITDNKPYQQQQSIITIKQSILVSGCDKDKGDIDRNLQSIDRSMFLYQQQKMNNHKHDKKNNDNQKLSSSNLQMMKMSTTMMKRSIIDEFGLQYEKSHYQQQRQQLPKINKLITHLFTQAERSSQQKQKFTQAERSSQSQQKQQQTQLNIYKDHFYYQQQLKRRQQANHVHNQLLKMNIIS